MVRAIVALALVFGAGPWWAGAGAHLAWATDEAETQPASATVPAARAVEQTESSHASQYATPVATVLSLSGPSTIEPKKSARVVASLATTSGVPIPGKTVVIERMSGTTAVPIASGATDAAGRFSVGVAPTSRIWVRARFAADPPYLAVTSAVLTIAPKVLLSTPWTHDKIAYPGQRLPARGTLWPKHATSGTGTRIVCERYENGKWVYRASFSAKIVNTKSGSRFSGVVKLPSAGTWRLRAKHADTGHATTYGPATKIKVTNWRKRYTGKVMRGFKTKQKMVAITIDDGPNRRTLEVCTILERYGGRGTFFFTRQLLNRGYGPQAKKAYDRGHEIANHTANHKMLTGSYLMSYRQASLPMTTIRKATGFSPTWIRAMGGGIDRTGMRAVVKTGQLYINWSIDSYDSHRRYTPPSTLYRNVMRGVRPGAVILIHQTHPETIKALPHICKELKRRGYKMVTLSELAATGKAP